MSLLLCSKTSCASPSGNFAPAKFTRNHSAFSPFADFSLSAKWCASIIKAIRAYSEFADHNKSVKRSFASRFHGILRDTSKITVGRGALFWAFICTDKADKSCKDFWFFLPLFLSKRKRGDIPESRRLSREKKKKPLVKEVFSVSVRFVWGIA